LEAIEKKVKTKPLIRLVGGGALAPLTCQLLSDMLGREIESVDNPQDVGAVGAAITAAVGLNSIESIAASKKFIRPNRKYKPKRSNTEIYNRLFPVFKSLYMNNKKAFHTLNK
jgi:xylulokinase